ncbi:MAG: hypothetical protein ACOYMN_25420, partial [Roseimicrobium sp.]
HPGDWINLGLPVGLREMERMLDMYYDGPADTLCFIYHPNLLQQCVHFDRLARSGLPAAKVFGWRTDVVGCLWLALRRRLRRWALVRRGDFMVMRQDGVSYNVDLRYCRANLATHAGLLRQEAGRLRSIVSRFQRTLIFRVPIKQDLAANLRPDNQAAKSLVQHYEQVWQEFTAGLSDCATVTLIKLGGFGLADFHGRDTHWNRQGNRRFADLANRAC